MSDDLIVREILASYQRYMPIPVITPAPANNGASAQRRPFQDGTDRQYILELADRYGFTFYVRPGPIPGANTAYWGPAIRPGVEQPALAVNLGPLTNIDSISFEYDALSPETVGGSLQDPNTSAIQKLLVAALDEMVLSRQPALTAQRKVRSSLMQPSSGLTFAQALARAQARVDTSSNETITAQGQLDAMRYGGILQARSLVGVRGAGTTYDGKYYVKSVTHSLQPGSYTQSFTLTRQGTGSASLVVTP
jgi:phage protein D